MKNRFRWILLTLVLAVVFHLLTVTLFPIVIMALQVCGIKVMNYCAIHTGDLSV